MLAAGGFQYTDGALVADETGDPEPVTEFAPAGRVGTRIPHRWLDSARTRSTLDLAGPGWAVLSSEVHEVEPAVLGGANCLLLRPDQIVAWRGGDPAAALAVRAHLLQPDRSARAASLPATSTH